jgi:hypothetical protein
MNFWQFLCNVGNSLQTHGTRVLSFAIGTLTTLTATGIVPEPHLKYYLAAITVLTYWRGSYNADIIATKVADKMAPKGPLDPSSPEVPK